MAASSGGAGRIPVPGDCLIKATEAASKVNALLIAKGKLKPSQLGKPPRKASIKSKFDAEVDINDAPIICRDILTKNATQEEIARKTGAVITTKGRYIKPEQRHIISDTITDRPLYLYIQAETEDNVQKAVGEINKIILNHGGVVNQTRGSTISIEAPLSSTDTRQHLSTTSAITLPPPDLSQPPPNFIPTSHATLPPPQTQVPLFTEKLYIGLEHAPPTFDVRGKVAGAEGSYLQHIHKTTGAMVLLKGRNSGSYEVDASQEATEPMHIYLQHVIREGLEQAKSLANDLVKTVQNEYAQFQRQIAMQASSAVASHSQPLAGHATLPSHAIVTVQNVVPSVFNYQTQEQQQVILSSASAATVPMSVVLSHPPPYTHTKTPMYVQSGVQAVPVTVPVTAGLVAHTPVGYNSLTSQGVEIVHQAVPMSSIQPLSSDTVSSIGSAQSLRTVGSLMETAQPATMHAPQAQLELPPHGAAGLPQTVAVPVTVSIQMAPSYGAPADTSHHIPVSVSMLPVICTTANMTSSNGGVIIFSQPVTSVSESLSQQSTGAVYRQLPVTSNHQQTSVIGKAPVETVAYIVQGAAPSAVSAPQAIEAHMVHLEPVPTAHVDAPNRIPPPAGAAALHQPAVTGHVATVLAETPASQHQQTLTINEYGQPMVQAPVSMVHVQPHHETMPHRFDGGSIVRLPVSHMDRHPVSTIEPIRPPSHIATVPMAVHHRYPLPTVRTPAPVPPPALPTNHVVVPSLMDLDVQVRQPPPPPPTIEPPPHLADSPYPPSKRAYRDKPYYQGRNEIRPPYRGAGRPHSSISPSSAATITSRAVYQDSNSRYKCSYDNYTTTSPP